MLISESSFGSDLNVDAKSETLRLSRNTTGISIHLLKFDWIFNFGNTVPYKQSLCPADLIFQVFAHREPVLFLFIT